MKLSAIITTAKSVMKKNAPELLIGVGIAGMLGTAVLAVKATPKALRLIEDKKEELNTEKLTPVETVKTAWACYIPAALSFGAAACCLVSAGTKGAQRSAALAAACGISENALREYKEAVTEVVGEKKEQAVCDTVAKNKLERNPVENSEIIMTGKGETLCFDSMSGRYFKSDIDRIKRAENAVNHHMLSDMSVSLNDLYYELGLDNIPIGEKLGWHVENGCFEIRFSSQLASDGTPCLVIGFDRPPHYGFEQPCYRIDCPF